MVEIEKVNSEGDIPNVNKGTYIDELDVKEEMFDDADVDEDKVDLNSIGPAGWFKLDRQLDLSKANDRMQILFETLEQQEDILSKMDGMNLVNTDDGKEWEFEGRIDGLQVASKIKVPGMTVQKFKEYRADILNHIPVCSNRMKAKRVGRQSGFDIIMIEVGLPAMLSTRVLFSTQYQIELEDGSLALVMNTNGN